MEWKLTIDRLRNLAILRSWLAVITIIGVTIAFISGFLWLGSHTDVDTHMDAVESEWEIWIRPVIFFICIGVILRIMWPFFKRSAQELASVQQIFLESPGPEHEHLENIVQEIASRMGIANPKVQVSASRTLGAQIVGGRKDSVIIFGSHLAKNLKGEELQALIAHEIYHLLHGDCRVRQFVLFPFTVLGALLTTAINKAIYGGCDFLMRLFLLAILPFSLMFTWIMALCYTLVLKYQERAADLGAVGYIGNCVSIRHAISKVVAEGANIPNLKKRVPVLDKICLLFFIFGTMLYVAGRVLFLAAIGRGGYGSFRRILAICLFPLTPLFILLGRIVLAVSPPLLVHGISKMNFFSFRDEHELVAIIECFETKIYAKWQKHCTVHQSIGNLARKLLYDLLRPHNQTNYWSDVCNGHYVSLEERLSYLGELKDSISQI